MSECGLFFLRGLFFLLGLWLGARIMALMRRGTVEAERDALRNQLYEARAALKPLAVALTRAEKVYGATVEDGWSVANTTVAQIVTYGDLRRARVVYEKIKGGRDE